MKKYFSLFLVLVIVLTSPVMAAQPTSNDMTDPLTYLLRMFQGRPGSQGPQGEPGITTVISNDTGPMGPQGPQGIQGIQGDPGVNGTAATINVNYTATVPYGDPATVTNIGSIWTALLDFEIPSGPPGAQGPAGAQGSPGINGTDGAPGAQGPQGEQGLQGIQGIQGATGETGATGEQGEQGDPGPQGEQGLQGIPGINGTDGAQGPQGIPGPVAGNNTELIYNAGGAPQGDENLTFNNITNTLTTDYFVGNGSLLTGIVPTGLPKFGATVINISGTGTQIRSYTDVGSTSWTAPSDVTSVEYLIVAGGGGGGRAGGGGAGGLLYCATYPVTPGAQYNIVVGSGGAAATYSGAQYAGGYGPGNNGANSSFDSIVAIGGGGGGDGTATPSGKNGGSGGGSGAWSGGTAQEGLGTVGQGYDGGDNNAKTGSPYPGGAGGGSSHVGYPAISNSIAGDGGNGTVKTISGSSIEYAGGGGGSFYQATGTPGAGHGGGGDGSTGATTGTSGENNKGGGGGGGMSSSTYTTSSGGSGIVILKYTGATYLSLAIAHGFGSTPVSVLTQLTQPNNICYVTSVNATHFGLMITDLTGAPGSNQTVYWMVGS